MTVAEYDSSNVECVWFREATKVTGSFPRDSVEVIEEEGADGPSNGNYCYCKGCGALPNASTPCPVYQLGHHSFVRANRLPVCKGCGKAPGSGTRCNSYQGGAHYWV